MKNWIKANVANYRINTPINHVGLLHASCVKRIFFFLKKRKIMAERIEALCTWCRRVAWVEPMATCPIVR